MNREGGGAVAPPSLYFSSSAIAIRLGSCQDTPVTHDDDDPPPPPGVKLRDPEDSEGLRQDIESGVMGAMQKYVHGYEYGGVRLELDKLHYADKPHYTLADQKEALMCDKTLAKRLRGNVRLVDTETNKVLDEKKNLTLARVPYLTPRGTCIHNGSEYALINQSRLLPGAYTRERENGELECHVNSRPGTGPTMRVTLDPVTAQYRLKLGTSDLHAYSVFKDLGVSDDELERRWGRQVLDINRQKYSKDAIDRAYLKAVPKWERDLTLSREEKAKAVRDAFDRTQVADSILKQNLPNLYSREKSAFWRAAGRVIDGADEMSKSASMPFSPDLRAEDVLDVWQSFDFDLAEAVKEASFDPDLSPEEQREARNAKVGTGPRLASSNPVPDHWLDDEGTAGWLQWYHDYASGKRTDNDAEQIARWKSFKRLHGAWFKNKPTPRRAYALINWAIDPMELLPEDKRDAFEDEMQAYRRKEFMRWYMNKHDFDDEEAERLGKIARRRGATVSDVPGAGELMTLALDGHIKPEDLH